MKLENLVGEFVVVAQGSYEKKDTKEVVQTVALSSGSSIIPNCRVAFPFKVELYKPVKLVFDISTGTYNGNSYESIILKGLAK